MLYEVITVIGTDVVLAVARFRAAHHRPFVAADVDQGAEAFGVPRHQDRRLADMRRNEIVRLGKLRLERQEIPGTFEDA